MVYIYVGSFNVFTVSLWFYYEKIKLSLLYFCSVNKDVAPNKFAVFYKIDK